MKSSTLHSVLITTILAGLAAPMPLGGLDDLVATGRPSHYEVKSLGTLLGGGTQSSAYGINNRGWVTGAASLAGDQNEHAFLWHDGVMSDLGTPGGPNGGLGPLTLRNNHGMVAGFGQTSLPDPLNENWNYTCTIRGTP